LVVLGFIGAAVWFFVSYEPPPKPKPPFDYGEYKEAVTHWKSILDRQPCDRTAIIKLGELLLQASDVQGAIDHSNQFFEKCGPYPRLRWISFGAYKRLSQFDKAVEEAAILIKSDPNDKDFWWWRGEAYELMGNLDKAAFDYRQAISVEPRLDSIPFNLADVLEKQGSFCEAIFPVEQFLFYHQEFLDDPRIKARLSRLRQKGKCNDWTEGKKAIIKFSKNAPTIITTALVNGKSGRFMIDTGASYVVLSQKSAKQSMILVETDKNPSVLVQTANGVLNANLVMAKTVQLKSVKANNVPTVVVETLPESIDGILGLSFLSRFSVDLNYDRGTLTLSSS
jgi:aspartyl protease family protein